MARRWRARCWPSRRTIWTTRCLIQSSTSAERCTQRCEYIYIGVYIDRYR